jgi:hypothetical protein
MVVKKSKKKSKNLLQNIKKVIPNEQKFILADGKIISSLKELAIEMENINEETFYHHVNNNKNDFAFWIRDVIKEIELAEKLMDSKEKYDFEMKLLKHIVKSI